MKKMLLWMLALTSTCFATPTPGPLKEVQAAPINDFIIDDISSLAILSRTSFANRPIAQIEAMLHEEAPTLSKSVIKKVLTTLKCARGYETENNNILTVIDYSLPSSEKRLWVFDLRDSKLLFYTYVSHGLKSGALLSNYFSNKYNSKASSIGTYATVKSYYGRDGLSLRLDGLDSGFNDNASNRSVVMHGGWYVNEDFIKKYGRAGRSWGCPALPLNLSDSIINTIKDKSLMVIYYPSDDWFTKSRFLNCGILSQKRAYRTAMIGFKLPTQSDETREEIVYVDLNGNGKHEESEPIIVMNADLYQTTFQAQAPLERMLRRQINNKEYIALTSKELQNIDTKLLLNDLYFVVPVLKMRRGYYITQMTPVTLGKIKDIKLSSNTPTPMSLSQNYSIDFEGKSTMRLRTTNQFIRWLGL